MFHIAYVEDEIAYSDQLETFISKFQKEKKIEFHLTAFSSADEFLSSFSFGKYDIILLDILLKKDKINGMDLAREIRKIDKKTILIFVTTMVQFAVEGYEVEALGYLVKPITYFSLEQVFNKALKRIKKNTDIFLTITNKGVLVKLPSSKITYIEVRGHSLTLHSTEGIYALRGSLDQMEEKLKDKDFVRCNNCYLVNLCYAYSIQGNSLKVGEDLLQISRPKKKAFIDALTKFQGDSL